MERMKAFLREAKLSFYAWKVPPENDVDAE